MLELRVATQATVYVVRARLGLRLGLHRAKVRAKARAKAKAKAKARARARARASCWQAEMPSGRFVQWTLRPAGAIRPYRRRHCKA